MTKQISVWSAWILGLIFIAFAVFYFITPAGDLPTFIPGYLANSTHVHVTHGIACIVVGLLLWAYAWFAGAKKVQAPTLPS